MIHGAPPMYVSEHVRKFLFIFFLRYRVSVAGFGVVIQVYLMCMLPLRYSRFESTLWLITTVVSPDCKLSLKQFEHKLPGRPTPLHRICGVRHRGSICE